MPGPDGTPPPGDSAHNTASQGRRGLPERVRELPGQAIRVAVIGVGHALLLSERVRDEYKETRRRGLQSTLNRLRTQGMGGLGRGTAVETTVPVAEPPPVATVPVTEPAEPAAAAVAAEPETQAGTQASERADADLPVPNYDELTLPSLRARLRNLSAAQVAQLRDYEKEHAAREDVITMFDNRIAKLYRESGA